MKTHYTIYRRRNGQYWAQMAQVISTFPLDPAALEDQARQNIEDSDIAEPAFVSTDDLIITTSWDPMPSGFHSPPLINPVREVSR